MKDVIVTEDKTSTGTTNKTVCYLGDDSTNGAAAYLAAVMKHYKIDYVRVNSPDAPPADFLTKRYALYIVSDYPSSRFSKEQMEFIADSVKNHGSGLLMIGGWESFYGLNGEYYQSPLANVLPVTMQNVDDRVNSSLPIILIQMDSHPILKDLPWNWPASIGGFNRIIPKKGSHVLLKGITIDVRHLNDDIIEDCEKPFNREYEGNPIEEQVTVAISPTDSLGFRPVHQDPILIVGTCGKGRTAAYASDLAPHWSGGLVDWGKPAIVQEVDGNVMEIGKWYSEFARNLVLWTMNVLQETPVVNVKKMVVK